MTPFDLRAGGEHRDGSLWVRRSALTRGERYDIEGGHGDEAIYVQTGSLLWQGREVEAGGAAVVEADAGAQFVAGDAGASLVHFGPSEATQPVDGAYGPPVTAGRGVHLVGPLGIVAIEQPGRSTRFFADSTCETCRITLFSTARDAEFRSASHSHSEDEILYVLDGSIQIRSTTLEPDMGVAIPGNEIYGFRSGEHGFRFLNYRRDVSTYRRAVDQTEVLERPRAMPEAVVIGDGR